MRATDHLSQGTKVPDLGFKELTLKAELSVQLTMEYTQRLGWRVPGSIGLTVHRLEKDSKGTAIPITGSQIAGLLPLILPPILKKVLPRVMPTELGEYLVASHTLDGNDTPVAIAGSVRIMGPDLSVLLADLSQSAGLQLSSTPPPGSSGSSTRGQQHGRNGSDLGRTGREKSDPRTAALGAALRVLGLDAQQATLLDDLYCRKLRCSSDHSSSAKLTIQELIRYHKKISRSDRVFEMTCQLWDQILVYHLDHVHKSCAFFSFRALMDKIGRRGARETGGGVWSPLFVF